MRERIERLWTTFRHPTKRSLLVMSTAVFLAVIATASATVIISFSQTLPATAPGAGPVQIGLRESGDAHGNLRLG